MNEPKLLHRLGPKIYSTKKPPPQNNQNDRNPAQNGQSIRYAASQRVCLKNKQTIPGKMPAAAIKNKMPSKINMFA